MFYYISNCKTSTLYLNNYKRGFCASHMYNFKRRLCWEGIEEEDLGTCKGNKHQELLKGVCVKEVMTGYILFKLIIRSYIISKL